MKYAGIRAVRSGRLYFFPGLPHQHFTYFTQMTVLVGGMRALDANAGSSRLAVFTDRPGTLSNDFFVNLLDMSSKWSKSSTDLGMYEGWDRATGKVKWQATPVDLIFGSNSELRAVVEVYGSDDAKEKFA